MEGKINSAANQLTATGGLVEDDCLVDEFCCAGEKGFLVYDLVGFLESEREVDRFWVTEDDCLADDGNERVVLEGCLPT